MCCIHTYKYTTDSLVHVFGGKIKNKKKIFSQILCYFEMDMFIAHKLTIYCFRLWEWNLKLCGKYVRFGLFFFFCYGFCARSLSLSLLAVAVLCIRPFPIFFFCKSGLQVNFDIDTDSVFFFHFKMNNNRTRKIDLCSNIVCLIYCNILCLIIVEICLCALYAAYN